MRCHQLAGLSLAIYTISSEDILPDVQPSPQGRDLARYSIASLTGATPLELVGNGASFPQSADSVIDTINGPNTVVCPPFPIKIVEVDKKRKAGVKSEANGGKSSPTIPTRKPAEKDPNLENKIHDSIASANMDQSTVVSDKNNFTLLGAAAQPRFTPQKNPDGVVRNPDEAIELAESYGVDIPHEDVQVVFMKQWRRKDADAEYFSVGNGFYNGTEQIQWDDFVMKQGPFKGKLVVRVNEGILDSDEAIVSTLGHEMHEINAILKMFDQRDHIPISEIAREINTQQFGGRPNNLHEQAWDVSDQLIKTMREQQ